MNRLSNHTSQSEASGPSKAPRAPAVDGIRAIAVTLVLLFHARVPGFSGGFIGVDVFFVLSGFLITGLLLTERSETGMIRLLRFYSRRALRLVPAMAAMLLAYLWAAPQLWPSTSDHGRQVVLAALYLTNFSITPDGTPPQLSHTWSLALEEQFYLVWPLLLLTVGAQTPPGRRAALFAGLWLAATLARVWAVEAGWSWNAVYYNPILHSSGLFLGAALAACGPGIIQRVAAPRWIIIALSVVVLAGSGLRWGNRSQMVWGFSLAEFAALALMLAVIRSGMPSRLLGLAGLAYIGRISYGIYLWHYPIMRALRETLDWQATLGIGAPLSIGIAALSHATIERWALEYRERVAA